MATSQFCSVCIAHDSIRACRAFLLGSPCAFSQYVLHTRAMPAVRLRLSDCTGHGSSWRAGPSLLGCRALSSVGSSPRSKKPAPTSQNPREEIRRLDEEIRRLEKERRSVGKPKRGSSDVEGKSLRGGKKGNANFDSGASSRGKNFKASSLGQNAKFASSAVGSGGAKALARYEQVESEEEDSDLDESDDDQVIDEDDEEVGEDFSSDAETGMESLDAEHLPAQDASNSASLVSDKPNTGPSESSNPISNQGGTEDYAIDTQMDLLHEVSKVDGLERESGHGVKHPWTEWNDFYGVLAQKNYFKDVVPDEIGMEGESYLRFQSSATMKRAILEFSRERDDIIRFLTKKHIKMVVAVGCPSTDRKVVNACKRLRVLCEIPEDEVCQQCKLKTFCTRAFAAPSPDLMAETADVARVLYSFALNASPIAESQVSYPINVVKSACHLVNEIVQLSAYPKDPGLPALKSRLPVKQPFIEKRDVDSNHHAGDWNCPECNFQNFAKNRQCRECGTSKGSGKQLEPGDWECPECTFVNFRRNRECRECSTPRPLNAGGNEPSTQGEWKCPECRFVNFRRNTECRKCSTRRPKGLKLYDEEDLEPGDWLCPECNFKNFKRNRNCKECGTVSPDQGKRDERWGLRKSVSSGGWGSARGMPSVNAESRAASGRMKHEEWTPDFSKKISDEAEDDLEEDADLVFGLDGSDDDRGMSKSSHASDSRTKAARKISQHKDGDDQLPSDFDLSDFDDLPKTSSKKFGGKGNKNEAVEEIDDDEDDDDNDMEGELSEDEPKVGRGSSKSWDDGASDDDLPISRAAVKGKPAKGRRLSQTLDDSDDDLPASRAFGKGKAVKGRGFSRDGDDSDDDDDDSFVSRATVKSPSVKGRALSRAWDDTDDDEVNSNDDDIGFESRKRKGASVVGSSKFGINGASVFGSSKSGINGAPRGGRPGGFRGRRPGEGYDRGGFHGRRSNVSESENNGNFTSRGRSSSTRHNVAGGNGGEGQRNGKFGRSRGRGRGRK